MTFNLPRIAALATLFSFGLPLTTATVLYSPPAAAVSPADYPIIVRAIDSLLASSPTQKIAAQLWDARAFYTGTAGAATELEITLTAAEAAELGIVGESGAATIVRFGLYGVIAYEVYYTGSLLWEIWDYSADIADLETEYIEASIELGMTKEEAVEEYYEDLYEDNTYYDNFVDIYCIWCD
jgi:hypothetical protein